MTKGARVGSVATRAVRLVRALVFVSWGLAMLGASPVVASPPGASPLVVDDFDDPSLWSAHPADGVWLRLGAGEGLEGRALRLDFDFLRGGGYAVARRPLDLTLPENYRFRLVLRGASAAQNLEFKLIDSTGANVWWCNQRDFRFPSRWDSTTIRRRQIEFAWGPAGGGELRRVAALEIAITAGSGGSGTVWLDRLTLEALPLPRNPPLSPVASASSTIARERARFERSRDGEFAWWAGGASLAVDGDSSTAWESRSSEEFPTLTLDLGEEREFGGLVLDWASPARKPRRCTIEVSGDRSTWRRVWEIWGWRARDFVYLPETEARFVRLRGEFGRRELRRSVALREVTVQPLAWSASRQGFFREVARAAPRGSYPRGMTGEMVYWTVVGLDGGPQGLLSEDGQLETARGSFSFEPFLGLGDTLVTWADVEAEVWLEEGTLPIPSVRWRWPGLELVVQAVAEGGGGAGRLLAHYRLRNIGPGPRSGRLHLTLRPFQVNPPTQFLNQPGGTAPIRSVIRRGAVVIVNDTTRIACVPEPSRFTAAAFAEADLAESLRRGRPATAARVEDPFAQAWAALTYDFELAPGGEQVVTLALPLGGATWEREGALGFEEALGETRAAWRDRVGRATIEGPPVAREALETLVAQIGYVLVDRKGAALQPGPRSYARTWIRDGSLTSAALLRLGHADVVRDFIDWFAPYQYENGKIPCCVDARGPDPVPEHDSSGEFIYLVAEYFRYTRDRDLVERRWEAVEAAAAYLDSLRQTRRTAEWREPENAVYFGLLPPSISHEGYSAKPMHSYWDDFFALRGFRDAAFLARVSGREEMATRWGRIADEFARELGESIQAAMRRHAIDFVPGAADLGDFDATSTTIALSPAAAEAVLPPGAVRRTFEKYYAFFRARRDGAEPWEAFTPYEWRNMGAFVRLGWRERAAELLELFLRYRRPVGWRHWAEVVWRDERAARFIGDMPHTWVGSDYARSLLDCFAYEREDDDTLVLGAGVPLAWVEGPDGVRVRDLRTWHGPLSFIMRGTRARTEVRIEAGLELPPGGLIVRPPLSTPARRVTVNGVATPLAADGGVLVRELPAVVVLEP